MKPPGLSHAQVKARPACNGIIVRPDVVRPVPIGLFDAQRVERVVAAVSQAVRACPRLDQRVVDRAGRTEVGMYNSQPSSPT